MRENVTGNRAYLLVDGGADEVLCKVKRAPVSIEPRWLAAQRRAEHLIGTPFAD